MPKNPRSYEKTRHIALSGLLFALAMARSLKARWSFRAFCPA